MKETAYLLQAALISAWWCGRLRNAIWQNNLAIHTWRTADEYPVGYRPSNETVDRWGWAGWQNL